MTVLQQAESLLAQLNEHETDILLKRIFANRRKQSRGIIKTPGVCGGRACIEGTRMPVWSLVNHRLLGFTDEEILYNFPTMAPDDLKNAWIYYEANKTEIDEDIRENYEDEEREVN
ncbi:MAG TPA: DUF433 domain-containing protein [Saprospiraceae bacterium]|nr:DUF433 domain-containing protein [Saprospiraceae bacterium]